MSEHIFLRSFLFITLLACSACSAGGTHHGKANKHMHRVPHAKLIERFEAPQRASWQKPDAVVAQLGDLTGKVVADIGCGSGYFAFRLRAAGARVICVDVDETFLSFVKKKRSEQGVREAELETRLVPYDSPGLTKDEVDIVLIVNTYHHIEGHREYFAKVKEGLKKGGSLVIIDYKAKQTIVGPPMHIRISADSVIKELRIAGFRSFSVDTELLPYQYIVAASLQ